MGAVKFIRIAGRIVPLKLGGLAKASASYGKRAGAAFAKVGPMKKAAAQHMAGAAQAATSKNPAMRAIGDVHKASAMHFASRANMAQKLGTELGKRSSALNTAKNVRNVAVGTAIAGGIATKLAKSKSDSHGVDFGNKESNASLITRLSKEHGVSGSKIKKIAGNRGINLKKKIDGDQKGELEMHAQREFGK